MTVLKILNLQGLYKRDWMAKVAWDQAPHWGTRGVVTPFFACLPHCEAWSQAMTKVAFLI